MTYAQFGEDEIADQLLGYSQDGHVVDIGAGDGVEISNSRLFRERGWKTLLVEAALVHMQALQDLCTGQGSRVSAYFGAATPENINTLVPDDVDLLSIDVDGDDYFLLEALTRRPRVIIVEHNPTIPYTADVAPARLGTRVGASVGALTRVAAAKGYGLAAVTHCNSIFSLETHVREVAAVAPPYVPNYYVSTDYFAGRPFVVGEAPWSVDFNSPLPREDVIIR